MMLDLLTELEQVAKVFKEKLGKSLVGIALFGSTTRGEAHIDSDWDIFMVTDELPDNPFERQMFLRSMLPKEMGTKISLMAKTKEEFEHRLLPVYLDIAADAMILFDPEGYLERKFKQIKEIIEREGLIRKKVHNTWVWAWKNSRGRDWELDWQ
ncbi:MAG: hypothetical protein DDT23_00581 [candidate division WS2 bacterium]|nr:hypothetical protein [Candidatus Lithacetigena glycinireducens]